jgi:hypothetical protein
MVLIFDDRMHPVNVKWFHLLYSFRQTATGGEANCSRMSQRQRLHQQRTLVREDCYSL